MKGTVCVSIDEPCQQSWDSMRTLGEGRHCAACARTVVDLTTMSDPEILQFLARAVHPVCGRFMDDQLDRPLQPKPRAAVRKAPVWWSMLLTGMLAFSRLSAQQWVTVDGGVQRHRLPLPSLAPISLPVRTPVLPVADPFKVLLPVVVQAHSCTTRTFRMGAVTTVTSVDVWQAEKQLNKLLCFANSSKKGLIAYPNPVNRDSPVDLFRRLTPGQYQVGLYNMAGVLMQQRIIEAGDQAGAERWEIPAGLPAGNYVFRAVRPGMRTCIRASWWCYSSGMAARPVDGKFNDGRRGESGAGSRAGIRGRGVYRSRWW